MSNVLGMSKLEVMAWLDEMERLNLEEQMLAVAASNPSESYIKSLKRKLQARAQGTTAQNETQHRNAKRMALMAGHAVVVQDTQAYIDEMKRKWRDADGNRKRNRPSRG